MNSYSILQSILILIYLFLLFNFADTQQFGTDLSFKYFSMPVDSYVFRVSLFDIFFLFSYCVSNLKSWWIECKDYIIYCFCTFLRLGTCRFSCINGIVALGFGVALSWCRATIFLQACLVVLNCSFNCRANNAFQC